MEQDRYEELLNVLRKWRDRFAENLLEQVESIERLQKQAENIYANEGVGEDFAPWLDRFFRQLAIQFILKVLFIRVLEDRGLLKIRRIRSRDSQQLFEAIAPHLGATSYLRFVFRDVARLLPDLFEEGEQDYLWPADDLTKEFLEEVWRRVDVEREGRLRYDFRGDGEGGFDTRFIGDLYQDIDAEAREYYALLQTPEFISQFILEHTLLKRFEEKDFREITLIDPTCGSGHFLVDAFYQFTREYIEAGEYAETPSDKATLARRIIEEHIFGADIIPYACALARFRLMLAACDFARPSNLEAFRDQHFNIACCDSLIPYEYSELLAVQGMLGQSETELEEEKLQRFGSKETIDKATMVFSRGHDVIVGNPPYIYARDPSKRDIYRDMHESAYWKFALSAPFVERFIDLAEEGGSIGLIVSNSFATRKFGKKLIEDVLPKYDLQSVIDLSGAYIPGHGTPTLIMFICKQSPVSSSVTIVSGLQGESGIPQIPATSEVWQSVLRGYSKGDGYEDNHVSVNDRPRRKLSDHPWQFGPAENELYEKLSSSSNNWLVSDYSDVIGFGVVTGMDGVYLMKPDATRRFQIPMDSLRPIITGKDIRDWVSSPRQVCIFPYDETFKVIDLNKSESLFKYFKPWQERLSVRRGKGFKTPEELGREWYEYGMYYPDRFSAKHLITFAEIATHNHFVPMEGGIIFHHSSPIIKLSDNVTKSTKRNLTAILNSSLVCFILKRLSYNKKLGKDPIRDHFDFTSTYVGRIPIPAPVTSDGDFVSELNSLSSELSKAVQEFKSLEPKQIFQLEDEGYYYWDSQLTEYIQSMVQPPATIFAGSNDLTSIKERFESEIISARRRLIFLQEEVDWIVYGKYDLIPIVPKADEYMTPEEYKEAKLGLGQRAFEQAGNGYKGDWMDGWKEGAHDHLPGPAAHLPELSENMKRLIQDRIEIIRTNEDVALLEDPLYKRRWAPLDFEIEFRKALEWWMREMAEWELEQAGIPLHKKEWSRRLMAHERVRAALEVYTGTPTYDPVASIEKIIGMEAVPNRPEHFMRTSGLRKLARGEIEFKRGDFSDGDAWKVRGKLNIPRERYIAYKEFEPGWYGWAGWDAEKRAEALVYLLEQAATDGWPVHHRQCGLRASLRDLLSCLEDLPTAEKHEFETIAYLCGISDPCFCTPFREAELEERPPGFDEPSIKERVTDAKSALISLF